MQTYLQAVLLSSASGNLCDKRPYMEKKSHMQKASVSGRNVSLLHLFALQSDLFIYLVEKHLIVYNWREKTLQNENIPILEIIDVSYHNMLQPQELFCEEVASCYFVEEKALSLDAARCLTLSCIRDEYCFLCIPTIGRVSLEISFLPFFPQKNIDADQPLLFCLHGWTEATWDASYGSIGTQLETAASMIWLPQSNHQHHITWDYPHCGAFMLHRSFAQHYE